MPIDFPGLVGLSGYSLIAVICGLLFLEEIGLPMPFAPGDLMLLLAGSAIQVNHLNPALVAAATFGAAIAGAMIGRELFQRLGSAVVPRLARRLHIDRHVDRVSKTLRSRGSAAVFVGRLTPGLRICTTQAAGLLAMPRLQFVRGLAPGVAVYQATFMILGAVLGPSAWTLIHGHGRVMLALAALIVLVGGAVIAFRAAGSRMRRPAARLEVA